jgi:hypothetical protein
VISLAHQQIIAAIEEPTVIERILTHLGSTVAATRSGSG